MVTMGSILDFLLNRYCKLKSFEAITPNQYKFYNFIKKALNNEIFEEKKYWELVQDYLRNFRTYNILIGK